MSWRLTCLLLLVACSVDRSPVSFAGAAGVNAGSAGSGTSGTGGVAGQAGSGFSGTGGFGGTGVSGTGTSGTGGVGGTGSSGSGGFSGQAGSGGASGTGAACVYAGFEVCNNVDDDCNGSIDDGFAQISCLLPNTSFALCSTGVCLVTVCNEGFANCDGNNQNGCEVLVDALPNDCKESNCFGGFQAKPSDRPIDDGNDCTIERCDGPNPESVVVDDGEPCTSNTGVCVAGVCAY